MSMIIHLFILLTATFSSDANAARILSVNSSDLEASQIPEKKSVVPVISSTLSSRVNQLEIRTEEQFNVKAENGLLPPQSDNDMLLSNRHENHQSDDLETASSSVENQSTKGISYSTGMISLHSQNKFPLLNRSNELGAMTSGIAPLSFYPNTATSNFAEMTVPFVKRTESISFDETKTAKEDRNSTSMDSTKATWSITNVSDSSKATENHASFISEEEILDEVTALDPFSSTEVSGQKTEDKVIISVANESTSLNPFDDDIESSFNTAYQHFPDITSPAISSPVSSNLFDIQSHNIDSLIEQIDVPKPPIISTTSSDFWTSSQSTVTLKFRSDHTKQANWFVIDKSKTVESTEVPISMEEKTSFITAIERSDNDHSVTDDSRTFILTINTTMGSETTSQSDITDMIDAGNERIEGSWLKASSQEDDLHDDETLFVGDKTIFNQDNTKKALQQYNIPKTDISSTEETKDLEENNGVPEFPHIESIGPDAEDEKHLVNENEPVDFVEENGELRMNNEGQTNVKGERKNGFIENEEYQEEVQTNMDSKPLDFVQKETTMRNDGMVQQSDEERITSEIGESHSTGRSGTVVSKHNLEQESSDSEEAEIEATAFKTPFTFTITSIDYIHEFSDINSGKFKKLRRQITPDLEEIFGSMFGHNFGGLRILNFMKGSVIVEGIVYTLKKINDMEQLATEFEQQITSKGSQIGGNEVDPRSISLNGFVSKNYVERIHEEYTSTTTSSYFIAGAIIIGIITLLLIAFAIITMNSRRSNRTLKLKDDGITMTENVASTWANAAASVNLMGYGRSRSGPTVVQPTNEQPPMVMIGSQMRSAQKRANS